MKNNGWKTTKQVKQCNAYPLVWAAIFGCKGERTGTWRYTIGAFGRRDVEYACPTCRAARDIGDALIGQAHQKYLTDAQAAAGVEDYRTVGVKRVDGVPTLMLGGE